MARNTSLENVKTTKKRSLINTYFTKDTFIDLIKVTLISDIDNNDKGKLIKGILKKYNIPFTGLGSGTNRIAVQIDGYAVKIALDNDGKIDNRREAIYSKQLYPYVTKVYECTPDGLVLINEFVEIFTLDDYHIHQNQMRTILSDISNSFLIGDVGVTGKNYVNWGFRMDGTICILDFAYIYDVKYNLFTCTCKDESTLKYDSDFVNLICPSCGRKYSFGEIRRRITRKQQEEEIGDIRRIGYKITEPEQVVEIIPEFEPHEHKNKKEKDEVDIATEEFFDNIKNTCDNWEEIFDDYGRKY